MPCKCGLPGGGNGPLARAMGEWMAAGRTIVMMTQVPYEGSDMAVYQVGQQVKEKYQLLGQQRPFRYHCNAAPHLF